MTIKKYDLFLVAIVLSILVASIFFFFFKEEIEFKFAFIPSALVDAPSLLSIDALHDKGIETIPFSTGAETAQALLGDAVEVATFAELPFLFASNQRNDLRIVAIISSANSLGIIGNTSTGIQTVSDLKGRKIGVPIGTSAQYLAEKYLGENNIKISDVEFVNLKPPQLIPALQNDDVDAISIWQPFLEKAKLSSPDKFKYLQDSHIPLKVIYCLVSTEKNITEKANEIKIIIAELIAGSDKLVAKDISAISKIAEANNLDELVVNSLLPLFNYSVDLNEDIILTLEELAVWANNKGMVDTEVVNRDWREFIDSSILLDIDSTRVKLKKSE